MPHQPTFQLPFDLADPRKRIADLKQKSPTIGGRIDALREALMKKFPSEYSNPDDAADHVISELLGFSVEVQFGVHASSDSELKACVGFEETEIQKTIQNLVYEINDISIDRITASKERETLLTEFRKNLQWSCCKSTPDPQLIFSKFPIILFANKALRGYVLRAFAAYLTVLSYQQNNKTECLLSQNKWR